MRTRRVGRTPAVAAALALALAVAACGDDAGSGDAGPTTRGPAGPTTTAPITAPGTGSPGTGSTSTVPPGGTATSTTAPPATVALADVAVALEPVVELDQPVAMATRPGEDDALYLADQAGTVHRLRGDRLEPTPVLDLSADTDADGEQGLLGLAFSPDGAWLYVNHTDRAGDTHVAAFRMGDGTAEAGSRVEVLVQEQPYANHNGGHLAFGPDGALWIGLGDGGSGNDPQRRAGDRSTLLGKMLRIEPTPEGPEPYTVPGDNPFVGVAGARSEIWSTGLRNPWRYSFDAATGDLWIADVGQGAREEVDRVTAADGLGRGASYGWSAFEGTERRNADVDVDDPVVPVHDYDRSQGGCSVTGGYVYRGAAVPELVGAYVFADYCDGTIRALRPTADGGPPEVASLGVDGGQVASFGQDQRGELYVLDLGAGRVLRLVPG